MPAIYLDRNKLDKLTWQYSFVLHGSTLFLFMWSLGEKPTEYCCATGWGVCGRLPLVTCCFERSSHVMYYRARLTYVVKCLHCTPKSAWDMVFAHVLSNPSRLRKKAVLIYAEEWKKKRAMKEKDRASFLQLRDIIHMWTLLCCALHSGQQPLCPHVVTAKVPDMGHNSLQ